MSFTVKHGVRRCLHPRITKCRGKHVLTTNNNEPNVHVDPAGRAACSKCANCWVKLTPPERASCLRICQLMNVPSGADEKVHHPPSAGQVCGNMTQVWNHDLQYIDRHE